MNLVLTGGGRPKFRKFSKRHLCMPLLGKEALFRDYVQKK